MRIVNGYIRSNKYQRWRKMPRRAWLKAQRANLLKMQRTSRRQDHTDNSDPG